MNAHTDILEALNWRYAVKQFDATKNIPDADMENLLEALRLSPSSYGLQPWKFFVITDQELREKLKPHSWNQSQITDCSHLVVLCRIDAIDEAHIDRFVELAAEAKGVTPEDLKGYKDLMTGNLLGHEKPCFLRHWASKQTYLALGNLLTSAAVMGIDACPIEGFTPAEYNKLLGLEGTGVSSLVVCALGYRSEEDKYAKIPKARFAMDDVVERM